MRIGLAQVRFPRSVEDGLEQAKKWIMEAGRQGCDIVCFPEVYLPGMRDQGFVVPAHDQQVQERVLRELCQMAKESEVAVVMGMEWETEHGLHNVAYVITEQGEPAGYQTKNQLPVEEEHLYVPGNVRKMFEVKGIPFGIAICHEGWRYPETVRWAVARGAQIVFHPHFTGGETGVRKLTEWGHPASPYYEKAMVARSAENAVFFASVNFAMAYQESATSLISPDGECLGHVPYGEEGLLVADVEPAQATRIYAKRYNPTLYGE